MELRLMMLGFGRVAQGFSTLISINSERIQSRYGVSLRFVAVADRGGSVISEGGLDPLKLVQAKKLGGSVSAIP
ncbi:MAG: homoserine dehydrogenase, partial [Candidatus Bathyarchaeia archaeon]